MNLGKHLSVREREINPTVIFQTESLPLVFGKFSWGPIGFPVTINDIQNFINVYGEPVKTGNIANRQEWYTVEDLLKYSTPVLVSRITNSASFNASTIIPDASTQEYTFYVVDNTNFIIGMELNIGTITAVDTDVELGDFITVKDIKYLADDIINNSVAITYSDDSITYSTTATSFIMEEVVLSIDDDIQIPHEDYIITSSFSPAIGSTEAIKLFARYPGDAGNDIYVSYCDAQFFSTFEYVSGRKIKNLFQKTSLNKGELAIVVLKKVSDTAFEVLESHIGSIVQGTKDDIGRNLFLNEVLFRNSNYIYGFVNESIYDITKDNQVSFSSTPVKLINGIDAVVTNEDIIAGIQNIIEYNENFKYIVDSGISTSSVVKSELVNIADNNESSVAILSIEPSEINLSQSESLIAAQMIQYKQDLNIASSYSAIAGNIKYRYDRFNDEYFWTGMAGDLAGLRILSDNNYFEWYAAAGTSRGAIRNAATIARLGAYYSGTILDDITKNKLNSFISSPIDGIICFGNSTLYPLDTGKSKLHIRMLLITLKQSISTYLKREIHEFNNEYTRNRITTTISQYLDRVLANQGVTDYRVICDSSNNTAAVIDNNELLVDVYIKPTRTSEFITLTVTNVGGDVKFEEIF